MLRRISALLCMLCCLVLVTAEAAVTIPEPTLSPHANPYDDAHPEQLEEDQLYALSAILIEADSGTVIFEKNAEQVMYPASTTKILTTLLGILHGDLDATVTASASAVNIPDDASTMGLIEGEEINFLDLLYGTMLKSANEGANLIAETIAGSNEAFVEMMNQYVRDLGLTHTHFANPDGYHDPNHYSSAYDLAMIAREAMKNETFRNIVSAPFKTLPKSNKHRSRTLENTNRLLIPSTESEYNKYYFPDAIGVKTGSTSMAGWCFVGAAERNGVRLISVVLFTGNRARWADTIKLMNYGFSQYISVTPADLYYMNPITIETSNYSLQDANMGKIRLNCSLAPDTQPVSLTVTNAEADTMANNLRDVVLIQYTRGFAAPVSAGEVMGTMTYFLDDGTAAVYNLTASRSVGRRENIPPSVEEIYDAADADPNPFPPMTPEIILILIAIFVMASMMTFLINRIIRRLSRRIR